MKYLKPGQTNYKLLIPYMLFVFSITFFDNMAMLLSLPKIQQQQKWSNSQAQWILTSFLIATTSCAIPLSRLGEKIGFVNIQYVYLFLTIVLDIAMFFTTNYVGFIVERFLFGAVTSGILGTKDILVRLMPEPMNIQKSVFTMIQTGNYICLIGPVLIGIFVQYISWRYMFIVGIFFSLCTLVCLVFIQQPQIKQEKIKFDVIGSVLLVIFISSICIFFSFLASLQYFFAGIFITLGIVFSVIFYFFEKRQQNAILNFKFCKNPVTTITICSGIGFLILGCLNYMQTQYLFERITSLWISVIQCLGQLFVIILMIFIPKIQKFILNRTMILIAMALFSIFNLCLLVTKPNLNCFIAFYILSYVSTNIYVQILYPMALMTTPPQFISQVAAFPTFARTFGQSLSYSIFAMLIQLFSDGFIYCIITCGVLCFVGFLLVAFRLGLGAYEKDKKGFFPSQVRQLKIDQAVEVHEVPLVQDNSVTE